MKRNRPVPANKYKARRTKSEILGRVFHSDGERKYAEQLALRQKAGEISDLRFQVRVTLLGCVRMIVDFSYFDNQLDCQVWDEYKGFETDKWQLQKKIWAQVGPGVYRITKASGRQEELIYPEPSNELVELVRRYGRGN